MYSRKHKGYAWEDVPEAVKAEMSEKSQANRPAKLKLWEAADAAKLKRQQK